MHRPLILFGKHAAFAALSNPMRKVRRVLVTTNARKELTAEKGKEGDEWGKYLRQSMVIDAQKLESMLPAGSVHQGIAVECEPLAQPSLHEWLEENIGKPILLLDQVTDPHNVGAILRSAVAFDAGAVIVTDRNAPAESGVMAKASSGALELIPLIAVTNLSQAIDAIKKAEYWTVGLDGEARQTIAEAKLNQQTALVLGAEGRGLRRLTGERCDLLVRLPMSDRMESLNVSNAAAVALYELYRCR